MKLFIKDRIYIQKVLPKTNTFLDYNVKSGIVKKVELTENDRDKYGLRLEDDNKALRWDNAKDMANPIDVAFSAQELEYIKKACEASANQLHDDDFWITVDKVYKESNV